MNHKWKQLTLVVNLLFGFRVNEIPNMTFIQDSHRPFILQCQEKGSKNLLPDAMASLYSSSKLKHRKFRLEKAYRYCVKGTAFCILYSVFCILYSEFCFLYSVNLSAARPFQVVSPLPTPPGQSEFISSRGGGGQDSPPALCRTFQKSTSI